ncbi:hypothetical protein RJ639_017727 [Escallonia herrerae]|uniref:Uncharacterized protein n=1 Tax=Escallonia herrerae TaxID=1293975 RepID=A0AA88VBX6_9ASTE|nr:hypothetical protein RJ639_017727 [Escallonia herrerae]
MSCSTHVHKLLQINESTMARSILVLYSLSRRRVSDSLRGFFFIPTGLALFTSLFILLYIFTTSNLFIHPHQTPLHPKQSTGSSTISLPANPVSRTPFHDPAKSWSLDFPRPVEYEQHQMESNGMIDSHSLC